MRNPASVPLARRWPLLVLATLLLVVSIAVLNLVWVGTGPRQRPGRLPARPTVGCQRLGLRPGDPQGLRPRAALAESAPHPGRSGRRVRRRGSGLCRPRLDTLGAGGGRVDRAGGCAGRSRTRPATDCQRAGLRGGGWQGVRPRAAVDQGAAHVGSVGGHERGGGSGVCGPRLGTVGAGGGRTGREGGQRPGSLPPNQPPRRSRQKKARRALRPTWR